MSKTVNVLIFPAGSVNGIEIFDSLKYNIHFNIFGASSIQDRAEYIYPKEKLIVGKYNILDEDFFDNFNLLLDEYNINYIIPTHDVIASFFAKNQGAIKAKIVVSPYETARIAENKYLTYEKLKENNFFPIVYKNIENIKKYPVFIKPYIGVGGKGAQLIKSKCELEKILNNNSDILISEYLPGKEFTVDCFTNRIGELLFIGPRKRDNSGIGITFRSEKLALNNEIEYIATILNKKFEFRGAWFFQVKEDLRGKLKLMEFSVRQAGTMGLYRQLGINFAALSLFDAMDYDVKILFNNYSIKLERILKPSYCLEYTYDNIYIDLDDTLIVRNNVNTLLIKYIYQCINLKKRVILITKHSYSIDETLSKYRICKDLFDEIIVVDSNKNKSDYITYANSIFIDNFFPERLMVKERCNIPVFDVDAVECLIRDNEL